MSLQISPEKRDQMPGLIRHPLIRLLAAGAAIGLAALIAIYSLVPASETLLDVAANLCGALIGLFIVCGLGRAWPLFGRDSG